MQPSQLGGRRDSDNQGPASGLGPVHLHASLVGTELPQSLPSTRTAWQTDLRAPLSSEALWPLETPRAETAGTANPPLPSSWTSRISPPQGLSLTSSPCLRQVAEMGKSLVKPRYKSSLQRVSQRHPQKRLPNVPDERSNVLACPSTLEGGTSGALFS